MGRLTRSGWFSAMSGSRQRRTKRSHPAETKGRRLRIERLEQRAMLAAVTVNRDTNVVNGDTSSIDALIANPGGDGITIHEAILAANATPGADKIVFHHKMGGAVIDAVGLTITDDVDIRGPIHGPAILAGRSEVFRNFNAEGRILDIAAGVTVSIQGLTFKNGDATNKEMFLPPGNAFGGAIRNAGTLTVRQCLFYHNGASEPGGGGGGAIFNSGTLTVIGSSFAANFAERGSGGAIYNAGTASVTGSTFFENVIGVFGGAIFNDTFATITVNNCTVLNSGGDPASHLFAIPFGYHGIANQGTMALHNTIVANTPIHPFPSMPVATDVGNTGILVGSHNLIKDGSGGLPGTIVGDPMLEPPIYWTHSTYCSLTLLPYPGDAGPPFTFSPLAGSPAIDAGNNSAASSFVDQRGVPRIHNSVVDIGAVEAAIEGVPPAPIVVTTLTDEHDGSIDPTLGAGTSLREALALLVQDDVTITFAPGLAGTIALDPSLGPLRIFNWSFSPFTRGDVTIVGPGADVLAIDGLHQTQLLIAHTTNISISGLTFKRGWNLNPGTRDLYNGGAIDAISFMTLSDCVFLDNRATNSGGAFHVGTGGVTVNNCSFVGNSSHDGGAIYAAGRYLIVNNSTFVDNSADHGGAIAITDIHGGMAVADSTFTSNSARRGGAIWAQSWERSASDGYVRPRITSSTFSENSATEYGGAIFVSSYKDNENDGAQLTVINSTISNNLAGEDGGGILVSGNLELYGSTVYGNSTASGAGGGISITDDVDADLDYVGTVTLVNNIVAGSTSGADLNVFITHGGTLTGSHNLIGDGSGGLPGTISGDPLLGPLADNGGATHTHAILPGSPAIDAGSVDYVIEIPGAPIAVFSDPSFETPSLPPGSYADNPIGSAWTFSGSAGLASNGSELNNYLAPAGVQVAFLEGSDSSISQVVHLAAGTYVLGFRGTQPGFSQGYQTFQILVDGAAVDTVTPVLRNNWTSHKTRSFTVAAGAHTIQISGVDPSGEGRMAFLDHIQMIPVTNQIHTIELPTTDQRGSGFTRVIGSAVDIGAYEDHHPRPILSPTALANGIYGAPYSQTITAAETDYTGVFTFAVTAGALPPGLSLASDGTLSGMPTMSSWLDPFTFTPFSFTVTATDANGYTGSRQYTLAIDRAQVVSSVSSSFNPSVVGQPVTFTATLSTVAPSTLPPAGLQIDFWDFLTLLGTATTDAAGQATFTISTLAVGDHPIYVLYGGHFNYDVGGGFSPNYIQTVLSAPVNPGDYNRNGTVDAADYVLWRKTHGTTGVTPYSGADGDGNGSIEQADYAVWRGNFGLTLPMGASGTSNVASQGSTAATSAEAPSNVAAAPATTPSLPQSSGVEQEPLIAPATTVSASSQRGAVPGTGLDLSWLADVAGSPQIRSERHIAPTLGRVEPLPRDHALLAWHSSYQSNNQVPTEIYSSVHRSNEGAREVEGTEYSALDEIFADLGDVAGIEL